MPQYVSTIILHWLDSSYNHIKHKMSSQGYKDELSGVSVFNLFRLRGKEKKMHDFRNTI